MANQDIDQSVDIPTLTGPPPTPSPAAKPRPGSTLDPSPFQAAAESYFQSEEAKNLVRKTRRELFRRERMNMETPAFEVDPKRATLTAILSAGAGVDTLAQTAGVGWEALGRLLDDEVMQRSGRVAKEHWRGKREEKRELIEGVKPSALESTAGQFIEGFVQSTPSLMAPGLGMAIARPLLGTTARMTQYAPAAGHIGFGAAVGVGGLQQGLTTYDEATQAFIEHGYHPDAAERMARWPAAVQAAGTGLLIALFGRTGIESATKEALSQVAKGTFREKLNVALKEAGLEGLQEASEAIYEAINAYLEYDPDKTVAEAAIEVIAAGYMGMALGGTVGVAGQFVATPPSSKQLLLDQLYDHLAYNQPLDPKTAEMMAALGVNRGEKRQRVDLPTQPTYEQPLTDSPLQDPMITGVDSVQVWSPERALDPEWSDESGEVAIGEQAVPRLQTPVDLTVSDPVHPDDMAVIAQDLAHRLSAVTATDRDQEQQLRLARRLAERAVAGDQEALGMLASVMNLRIDPDQQGMPRRFGHLDATVKPPRPTPQPTPQPEAEVVVPPMSTAPQVSTEATGVSTEAVAAPAPTQDTPPAAKTAPKGKAAPKKQADEEAVKQSEAEVLKSKSLKDVVKQAQVKADKVAPPAPAADGGVTTPVTPVTTPVTDVPRGTPDPNKIQFPLRSRKGYSSAWEDQAGRPVALVTNPDTGKKEWAIVGGASPAPAPAPAAPAAPAAQKYDGPTMTRAEAETLDKQGRLTQTRGTDWGKDKAVYFIPELNVFTRLLPPENALPRKAQPAPAAPAAAPAAPAPSPRVARSRGLSRYELALKEAEENIRGLLGELDKERDALATIKQGTKKYKAKKESIAKIESKLSNQRKVVVQLKQWIPPEPPAETDRGHWIPLLEQWLTNQREKLKRFKRGSDEHKALKQAIADGEATLKAERQMASSPTSAPAPTSAPTRNATPEVKAAAANEPTSSTPGDALTLPAELQPHAETFKLVPSRDRAEMVDLWKHVVRYASDRTAQLDKIDDFLLLAWKSARGEASKMLMQHPREKPKWMRMARKVSREALKATYAHRTAASQPTVEKPVVQQPKVPVENAKGNRRVAAEWAALDDIHRAAIERATVEADEVTAMQVDHIVVTGNGTAAQYRIFKGEIAKSERDILFASLALQAELSSAPEGAPIGTVTPISEVIKDELQMRAERILATPPSESDRAIQEVILRSIGGLDGSSTVNSLVRALYHDALDPSPGDSRVGRALEIYMATTKLTDPYERDGKWYVEVTVPDLITSLPIEIASPHQSPAESYIRVANHIISAIAVQAKQSRAQVRTESALRRATASMKATQRATASMRAAQRAKVLKEGNLRSKWLLPNLGLFDGLTRDRSRTILGDISLMDIADDGRSLDRKKAKGIRDRIRQNGYERLRAALLHLGADWGGLPETYKYGKDDMQMGRLAQVLVDHVGGIVDDFRAIEATADRASTTLARLLLGIHFVSDGIRTDLKEDFNKVKKTQSNPKSQNPILETKEGARLEEQYLPPRDPTGVMRWRLVNANLWNSNRTKKDKDTARKTLSVMPAGMVLFRVKNLKSESGNDYVYEPHNAWFVVEGDYGVIKVSAHRNVKGKSVDYLQAVYRVDLKRLRNINAAAEFKKSSSTGKTVINGWLVNPSVALNSALWEKVDNQLEYLSPEDLNSTAQLRFRSKKRNAEDAPFTEQEMAAGGDEVAEDYAQMGIKTQVSRLKFIENVPARPGVRMMLGAQGQMMEALEQAGEPGIRLLNILTQGDIDIFDNGSWDVLASQINQVLNPESDAEVAAAIKDSVESIRERRSAGEFVHQIGQAPPTTEDINPEILGQRVSGVEGITGILKAENNGMSREARDAALAMAELLGDRLNQLDFEIVPGATATDEVRYVGSYSHMLRLARVVANSGSANAAAHEMAHFAAQFLPTEFAKIVEQLRLREIFRIARDPETDPAVLEFLAKLQEKGGSMTSGEFRMMPNLPALLDVYQLINADEFFAFHLTNRVDRVRDLELGGPIGWIKGFYRQVVAALKRFMGSIEAERDEFFDRVIEKFEAGEFDISVNEGYLSELNAETDVAALAIAVKPQMVRTLARTTLDAGKRREIGTIVSSGVVDIRVMFAHALNQMRSEGVEVSDTVAQLALLGNFTETSREIREMFNVPLRGVRHAMEMLTAPHLRNQIVRQYMSVMLYMEHNQAKMENRAEKWAEHLTSEEFRTQVEQWDKARTRVWDTEALHTHVSGTIKAAIVAALRIARDRKSTPQQVEKAERDRVYNEKLEEWSRGITQKIEQIVEALSRTDDGFALLEIEAQLKGRRVNWRDIVNAWKATNPPTEQLQVEAWVIEEAATMLAKNEYLRTRLAAEAYARDPEVMKEVDRLAKQVVDVITKQRNSGAIRRMLAIGDRAVSREEKAKRVFVRLNRHIKSAIKKASDYEAAADLGRRVIESQEYKATRAEFAAQAGERYESPRWPTVSERVWGGTITAPLPISNTTITIDLQNNGENWSDEQRKAEQVIHEIDEWMADEANHQSLDMAFLQSFRDHLTAVMWSSITNDFASVRPTGPAFLRAIVEKWGIHFESLARRVPTRAMQAARVAMRGMIDQMLMMEKWGTKWLDRTNVNLSRAAGSHKDDIYLKPGNQAHNVFRWYEDVGREFFFRMSNGETINVGDRLADSGHVVTAEDMKALVEQVQAFDDAYDIDIVRGREGYISNIVVEDEIIPGVKFKRKHSKLERFMLPRTFNIKALDFAREYTLLNDMQTSRDQLREMLDAHFNDFVLSFLGDQDGDFRRTHNLLYSTVAGLIRSGEINSMRELENFIDANATVEDDSESEMMSDQLYADIASLLAHVYKNTMKDLDVAKANNTPIQARIVEAKNSFTLSRGRRIAPYWFYNFGITNGVSGLSFKMTGSSYYYERFVKAMDDVRRHLETDIAHYNRKLSLVKSKEQERALLNENKLLLREGKETLFWEELHTHKAAIDTFMKELDLTVMPGGRITEEELRFWVRALGTRTAAILFSPITTIRNWYEAMFVYNGQRMMAMMGGLWRSYRRPAMQAFKQLLLLPVAAGYALGTSLPQAKPKEAARQLGLGVKEFVTGSHKGKKGAVRSRVDQLVYRTLRAWIEVYADPVQNAAEKLWLKSRAYEELKNRGMDMPINVRARMEAMAESIHTYGQIGLQEEGANGMAAAIWGMLAKGGKTLVALTDFFLIQGVASAFAPRIGDQGANVGTVNTVQKAMVDMEAHLRLKYARMKDGGIPTQLSVLTPADVLPNWFGERRDLKGLQMLTDWFGRAAMPLKEMVNDYYRRLDAATEEDRKNVRFLTEEQLYNIAQISVEDNNNATVANRPLKFKQGLMSRMAGMLVGWGWNMLSNQMYWFGKVQKAGSENEGRIVKAQVTMMSWWFLLATVAMGALKQEMLEMLLRRFSRVFGGEERASRQIWELEGGWDRKVRHALAGAATMVPMVGGLAQWTGTDQPTRQSAVPLHIVQSDFLRAMNYVMGAVNAKDATYGLEWIARAMIPTAGVLVFNHHPEYSGRIQALNARRLLSRYGDQHLRRNTRMDALTSHGALATVISPYGDRLVNAAMHEEYGKFQSLFNEAVRKAMDHEGLNEDEARDRIRQVFTSRNPYSRAYRMKPTANQRYAILARMRPDEREAVIATEELLRRAASTIGANMAFTQDAGSRSSGSSARGYQQSSIRHVPVRPSARTSGSYRYRL
jgi:hypothetical protein